MKPSSVTAKKGVNIRILLGKEILDGFPTVKRIFLTSFSGRIGI
jgi:hypothetical protein